MYRRLRREYKTCGDMYVREGSRQQRLCDGCRKKAKIGRPRLK